MLCKQYKDKVVLVTQYEFNKYPTKKMQIPNKFLFHGFKYTIPQ